MSADFKTVRLVDAPRVQAPDGSQVDILAQCRHGSMARFILGPGLVSLAVRHRTVEELWFIQSGAGEMWRAKNDVEDIVILSPGLSLAIPVGASFQFKCNGPEPLVALGVTMPPWPGAAEAEFVTGKW